MEPGTLLQADYVDIIFDRRNKNYGAYQLRKHYDQRIRKALLFLLLGLTGLICFSFIIANKPMAGHSNKQVCALKITDIKLPLKQPLAVIKERKSYSPPPSHIKTKLFTDPVIDHTDNVPDNKQIPDNRTISAAHPGSANANGDSADISTGTGASGKDVIKEFKSDKPVMWIEHMPQFNGEMQAYINSHLNYPDAARESNIDGTVSVRFVVNEDGSVSDATIIRGIGGGCDEEALRMVNGMLKWQPGKQNGIAVKVYFTLPIKFVLN